MDIDQTKQQQALQKAQDLLKDSEQNRAAVRLESCFRDFVSGRNEVLEIDEIVHNFATFMYALHEEGDSEVVFEALQRFSEVACSPDRKMRERAVTTLSVFINLTIENDDDTFLETLSTILIAWLKEEQQFIAGFEFVCSQLQRMVHKLLLEGKWYEAENLVVIIYQVTSGIIKKSNVIVRVVEKCQAFIADEAILEELLDAYLEPYQDERDIAESLLTHLGHRATRFLFNRLLEEDSKERRFLIIEMMPVDETILKAVWELLDSDPPWYVVRNVILVLSRSQDERFYETIIPFASHSDMRVQQQVINAIWKMGGDDLVGRLLAALTEINDELKTALVTQLGQMRGNSQVGIAFINLLENSDGFSRLAKDDLISILAVNLAFFPSYEAAGCLEKLVAKREASHGNNDRLVKQITASLGVIKKSLGAKSAPDEVEEQSKIVEKTSEQSQELDADDGFLRLDDNDEVFVEDDEDDFLRLDASDEVFAEDDKDDLLRLDDTDEVFEEKKEDSFLGFDENELFSDSGDEEFVSFTGDDTLDDDPESDEDEEDDAFLEILAEAGVDLVSTGTGMSGAEHHFSVWSDFYESMSTSEFDQFYPLLEKETFHAGEHIVHSDGTNQRLFFIDSGDIEIMTPSDGDKLTFKNIQSGEVIGGNQFFIGLPWPFTLIAQEKTELHILSIEAAETFFAENPEARENLEKYCSDYDVAGQFVEMLKYGEVTGKDEVKLINSNGGLDYFSCFDDPGSSGALCGTLRGGMCVTAPITSGASVNDLSGILVEALLCDEDEKCSKFFGVVLGWQKLGSTDEQLRILIKFYHPYKTDQYSCQSLSFL